MYIKYGNYNRAAIKCECANSIEIRKVVQMKSKCFPTYLEVTHDQHTLCNLGKDRKDDLSLMDKESCGKFLPMCNEVGAEHLPLASSVAGEKRHRPQLRNLPALKCAQEVGKAVSFPANTNTRKYSVSVVKWYTRT